jgi:hypothetical protein
MRQLMQTDRGSSQAAERRRIAPWLFPHPGRRDPGQDRAKRDIHMRVMLSHSPTLDKGVPECRSF